MSLYYIVRTKCFPGFVHGVVIVLKEIIKTWKWTKLAFLNNNLFVCVSKWIVTNVFDVDWTVLNVYTKAFL